MYHCVKKIDLICTKMEIVKEYFNAETGLVGHNQTKKKVSSLFIRLVLTTSVSVGPNIVQPSCFRGIVCRE